MYFLKPFLEAMLRMPLFKKIIKLPDREALLNIEVILKTDNSEFCQTFSYSIA